MGFRSTIQGRTQMITILVAIAILGFHAPASVALPEPPRIAIPLGADATNAEYACQARMFQDNSTAWCSFRCGSGAYLTVEVSSEDTKWGIPDVHGSAQCGGKEAQCTAEGHCEAADGPTPTSGDHGFCVGRADEYNPDYIRVTCGAGGGTVTDLNLVLQVTPDSFTVESTTPSPSGDVVRTVVVPMIPMAAGS